MKIRLNEISKKYNHNQILDQISFQVEKGTLLSILGESGAGKTTILRIIAGLAEPDGGNLFIDETDCTRMKVEKRNIGYVFQSPLLFPHMTVEQNICFGLEVKKWSKNRIQERKTELVELVQIEGLEKRMPSELSGGQQQRVAIARALAPETSILLMDEPFSNLDPSLRGEMGRLIKKIQEKTGMTIVFVTHDRNESMALSDTIALLMEGRLAQVGGPEEIFYKPESREVAAYMGLCNFIPGKMEGDLFICKVGRFLVENPVGNEMEWVVRPHQIKINCTKTGFRVVKRKITGKEVLYTVADDENQIILSVEEFSDRILSINQRVGLDFPVDNLHFLRG